MASTISGSSSTIRMRSRSMSIRNLTALVNRKLYGDHRPAVGGIFCTHRAAVLIDNSLHNTQSQSSPAATLGVERLEDLRQVGISETRSEIPDSADDPT